MVIENKVDAREQEVQLGRYAAWLDTQSAFSAKHLLFLTPDGRPPQTAADRCRRVSYREHMRSWLEQLLAGVLPETVRFAVQQYLQTVESLSGGPMSTTNESPILKALMKEEDLLTVLEIVSHAEQIREQVMVQFWRGLESAIRKQQPAGLPIEIRRVSDDSKKRDSGWGALEVRPAPSNDQAQGLYYALEAWRSPSDGNMCTTVFWQRDAGESLATLLGLREVRELQAALNKCAAQTEGRVEPEPKPGFLWAQYWWEFRPGESFPDPLSWFASESRSDRQAKRAARFWELIGKTHKLLVKANEAVKRV